MVHCNNLSCNLKYFIKLWIMLLIFFEGITTIPFYFISGILSYPMLIASILVSIFISFSYVLINYDNRQGYEDLL